MMESLHPRQSGAALLSVLVVAIILALMISAGSRLLERRLSLASDSKSLAMAYVRLNEKVSELKYYVATQELTVVGVSQGPNKRRLSADGMPVSSFVPIGDEIRADGFKYKEEDGLVFSLQNEMGLIPINSSSPFWLKRWLSLQGLSPAMQSSYANRIADYADSDDWQRPSGAELSQYDSQSISTLPNYLLQQCSEIQQIVGFDSLLELAPGLIGHCSLRRTSSMNINAIPIQLWQDLWPDSVSKVLERRNNNSWFVRPEDVRSIEPAFVQFQEDWFSTLGGVSFAVTVEIDGRVNKVLMERGTGLGMPLIFKSLH